MKVYIKIDKLKVINSKKKIIRSLNINTMKLIQRILGDQVTAKYRNTKLYITQGVILIIKTAFVFVFTILLFLFIFFIINPGTTQKTLHPLFEVSKINQKYMLTTYVNTNAKLSICHQQPQHQKHTQHMSEYNSKLYSKQQYCQLHHHEFPFEITRHNQIDIFINGLTRNVEYVTGCVIRIHSGQPVCQKFPYQQNIQIFNNLILESLYSIEIELKLRKENQQFGDIQLLFKQENGLIVRLIKEHYYIVTLFMSIIFAMIAACGFGASQIPQILDKAESSEKNKVESYEKNKAESSEKNKAKIY